MNFWSSPYVWVFLFAMAFLVILKEWFTAHYIIDKRREEHREYIKLMRMKHWEIVTELEKENEDLKRRLGR